MSFVDVAGVPGHLHHAVQPKAQAVRPSLQGRYKSLLVDGSTSGYLKAVCDYVHLNPVRAKLLKPEQPLSEYPWQKAEGRMSTVKG
jgi:hypothetical protein